MHLTDRDWAFVEERTQDFTGREWVFERVRAFLASDARMLVIVAPPGAGKTAIAARLAQASAGHLAQVRPRPVPADTIDAAVFCQTGRVSMLEVAQDLAGQLSSALPGFADEQRSVVAATLSISNVHVETGDVSGGNVAGVRIDLATLGPDHAFDDGVALPLRRLADKPGFRPPIVLVDSLDEAFSSTVAQGLPRRLAELIGVRLITTTRDDTQVLAQIGLDAAVAAGQAVRVDLVSDAPDNIGDVADYVVRRLHGHGRDDAIAVLAGRIGGASAGNFLYAYIVAQDILDSDALVELDTTAAGVLPLPVGGLSGVYRAFVGQGLARDLGRWRDLVRPIIGAVAVSLGHGLDTAQLASIGGIRARVPLRISDVRDVTFDAGQFLQGKRPDGPFTVYHRSFAEFLLDAKENADWPVDAQEANEAIVTALIPRDTAGIANWTAADPYTRTYLASHAAAAGRLDDLMTDLGFLVVADMDQLVPLLWRVGSPEAREAAAIVQLASADVRGRPPSDRVSYLELAARLRGADEIADRIGGLVPDRVWSVPGAQWRGQTAHIPLDAEQRSISSVAMAVVDDRPLAVSAGGDGTLRVWDISTLTPLGEPLRGHEGGVASVAIGWVGGRPVVVSGGDDGTVRLWDLRTRLPIGQPITGQEKPVAAVQVADVDGHAVIVSGGMDGTIRLWDLETLEPGGTALHSDTHRVLSLAVGDFDGHPVAVTGGDDGNLRVWELKTLAPLGDVMHTRDDDWIGAAAIARIGGRPVVFCGGFDGIQVWDLRSHESLEWQHEDPEGGIFSLAVGRLNERPVVLWGTDDGIRGCDLETLATLGEPLRGHEGVVSSIAVGQVGRRPVAVSGGSDSTVRVWDLENLAPAGDGFRGHDGYVVCVAVGVLNERPVAISGGYDGTVRLWDLASLKPIGEPLHGDQGWILAVALGRVGGEAVAISGGYDGTIRVWNLGTLTPIGEPMRGDEGRVIAVAAGDCDDRAVMLSGGDDGSVHVWDLGSLTQLGESVPGHGGWIETVAVGMIDDRPIGVSGVDDTIRVWDLRSHEALGEPLSGHTSTVTSVAIGTLLGRPVCVSGSWDGTVRVWDLRTLTALGEPLRGHEGFVRAVATGEMDGRPVAVSGGEDATVRVWDLPSGSQAAVIAVPSVTSLAMGGNGRIALTAASGLIVIRINHLPVQPAGAADESTWPQS